VLFVSYELERLRVEPEVGGTGIGDQSERAEANTIRRPVLEQSMDHDNIRPYQLGTARNDMLDERAVMRDQLQVKRGNSSARLARARRAQRNRPSAACEREVGRIKAREQPFSVSAAIPIADEDGVPLELRQRTNSR
jgi:hypothetical protein